MLQEIGENHLVMSIGEAAISLPHLNEFIGQTITVVDVKKGLIIGQMVIEKPDEKIVFTKNVVFLDKKGEV